MNLRHGSHRLIQNWRLYMMGLSFFYTLDMVFFPPDWQIIRWARSDNSSLTDMLGSFRNFKPPNSWQLKNSTETNYGARTPPLLVSGFFYIFDINCAEFDDQQCKYYDSSLYREYYYYCMDVIKCFSRRLVSYPIPGEYLCTTHKQHPCGP